MYKINTFVLILYSSEKITIKNKSVFSFEKYTNNTQKLVGTFLL